MSGLAGMLMGISNDIGNPTQLSEGQKGLFNTLGASLAPMPAVNPDDPASLRAAAAEAMRRGDAQQARIYAVMASERENSVRQKNASQNALLDEGNAEIQAEAARKRGLLSNMQAGAAYERFLSPDLLQAVKRGDIAVPDAMKAQQTMNAAAMKEQAANSRAMFLEQGRNSRAAARAESGGTPTAKERQADLLFPRGSQEWRDFMLGKESDKKIVLDTIKLVRGMPEADLEKLNKARDTVLTINGLPDEAGSAAIAQRSITDMFPNDVKAVSELKSFAASKSLPRRIGDQLSMWYSGTPTGSTLEDYKAIARLLHEFEADQLNKAVKKGTAALKLSPDEAKSVEDFFMVEPLPSEDGWEIVGAKPEGAK